jgi:flagellar motor switch protein FliN/FliY
MPLAVARQLAAAVHGEAAAGGGDDLAEPELDALRQAARKVMDAVAAATGAALELEESAGEVDVNIARSGRDVKVGHQGAARATLAVIQLFDEPCQLVQLVPNAFTMRLASAGDDEGHGDAAVRDALGAMLRDVPLRVWAEVGRARLRSAEVASLADGAIVELDRAAEDPVDLYVNGSRIATGRLVCIDGKEWAVRLEEVFPAAEADPAAA